MTRSILLPALLILGVAQGEAAADSSVGVRFGEHPGHSRVVFDWQQPTSYTLRAEGGRIELRFASAGVFDLGGARPLRHVRGIAAEGNTATIVAEPGATVRHFTLGGRVVVDVGEPERQATTTITATAATSTVAAAVAAAPLAAVPAARRPPAAAPPVVLAQLGAPATGLPAGPLAPQRPPASPRGQAQAPLPQAPAAGAPTEGAAPSAAALAGAAAQIRLEAGTGRLVTLPSPAATVMAADPRVVRVQPSSPTSIFMMAGAPGRTTIIATNEAGQPVAEYAITVVPGAGAAPTASAPATGRVGASATAMEAQLRSLIPGPGQVRVRIAGEQIILTGTVPTAADARRAEAIVRGMGVEDVEVLNELAVLASIQVNLRVRVAEITREVTRQFGFNWQALGQSGNFAFGLRTGSIGLAAGSAVGGSGGNALNASGGRFGAAYSSGGWDANVLVDTLAAENLVTILAEPNLTAQSGEVASFLAGGEFPIPVSAGNDGQIGIEFKSFGVSLAFVPIVLSNDRLTLRVRPEVSELSEQGAISIPISNVGIIRIPALSVRRAETTIELGSGQSFAIAGLLQRSSLQGQDGVNGLVDIPVLGALFRSDRFQRRETELVIIVTPYLVQPSSDPAALTTPTDAFRPATSLDRILTGRQVGGVPRTVPGVSPGLGFRLN